jgi:hypothetical protein
LVEGRGKHRYNGEKDSGRLEQLSIGQPSKFENPVKVMK